MSSRAGLVAMAALLLLVWMPPRFFLFELAELVRLASRLGVDGVAVAGLGRAACIAAVIAAGWIAVGEAFGRWTRGRPVAAGSRLILAGATGLGVTGTALLGLGLCGAMRSGVLRTVAIGLGACGVMSVVRLAGRIGRRGRPVGGHEGRFSPAWWGFAALLALPWPFLAVDLLAPEGSWDAIVLHLAAPARWLEAGRIGNTPQFFQREPVLMCCQYALGLAAGGVSSARLLNVAVGVLLAGAVAMLAGRLALAAVRRSNPSGGVRVAAMAGATVIGTSPLISFLAVHAGADVVAALFTVLAVRSYCAAWPAWPAGRPDPGGLVMAGGLAGLAGACKLPGLGTVAALGLLSCVRLRSSPWLAVGAVAGCGSWLVRSWLWTGNPVYPLLAEWFPSPFWTEFSNMTYGEDLGRTLLGVAPGDLVAGWTGGSAERIATATLIGPVGALGAAVALLGPGRSGGHRIVVTFGAALAVGWAVGAPSWRLFGGGLAVLSALIGAMAADRTWRWIPLVASLLQAVRAPQIIDWADGPWAAARGEISREQYYSSRLTNPTFDAAAFLLRHAGARPGRGVLACGDHRDLLLPPWTKSVSVFEPDPLLSAAAEARDGAHLAVKLRQCGIGWLLVNVPESLRQRLWESSVWHGEPPTRTLAEFFNGYTRLRYARAAGWVYEVGRNPRGAVVPECYRPWSGGWRVALACASQSRRSLVANDPARAARFAWAAVAAAEYSGLAWATVGDIELMAGRNESAAGAYLRAIEAGWRTSSVYRNVAAAYARQKLWGRAEEVMRYAIELDPDAQPLRAEQFQVLEGTHNFIYGRPPDPGAGAR